MKKFFMMMAGLAFLLGLTGCGYDNTALVVTTNLSGTSNETVTLINTDDLKVTPVKISLDGMDHPNMVVVAPDSTKAYIASGHYPIPLAANSNKVQVIDTKAKTLYKTLTVTHGLLATYIFDIGLNASGSRLYIGSWSPLNRAYIDIYDTNTMERVGGFQTGQGGLDLYNYGWKLAAHPTLDVVYVLAADGIGINARVRAFSSAGSLLGGKEYPIDNSGIENLLDYKLTIDPKGDLLLALSSKTFPFGINADGSLRVLYDANKDGRSEGIDWQATSNSSLFGKTDVLFTKDKGTIYINSAGVRIGSINLGGGSICMSKAKILAEDPNPYIYSLTDFINNVLPWIVKQLGYGDISDIIDATQLYGVSTSVMVDNTCFMFIAPVASIDNENVTIKNVLAVFNSVFTGVTPLWVGGMTTTTYSNNMAVNPQKNTLCLSNKWGNSIDVYAKDSILGWAKMKPKGTVSLGDNAYPQTMGMTSMAK